MPTTWRPPNDRDRLDAPLQHEPTRLGGVGVLGQCNHRPRHHLGGHPGDASGRVGQRSEVGTGVGGQLEGDQVGLGHDADQLAGIHHRHGADPVRDQQVGDLLEPHVRRHRDHRARHDIPDPHVGLLAAEGLLAAPTSSLASGALGLQGPGSTAGAGPSALRSRPGRRFHGIRVEPGEDPMHSLVQDLMTQVVTVEPTTPFKEVVARLVGHRVSAVSVVDDDRRVLSLVSEPTFSSRRSTRTPSTTSRWSGPSGAGPSARRRPRRWRATSWPSPSSPSRPTRQWPRQRGACAPPGSSGRRWSTRGPAGRHRQPRRPLIDKTLQDAGSKLDSVASDLLGVSGRAMLTALVAGSATPRCSRAGPGTAAQQAPSAAGGTARPLRRPPRPAAGRAGAPGTPGGRDRPARRPGRPRDGPRLLRPGTAWTPSSASASGPPSASSPRSGSTWACSRPPSALWTVVLL